ncbi:Crp/Fnr family transcriptional regulator [Aliiglaciecola sp. LCG003]|uniref:Crp/Fnr family transcriptional regulator n=1 Tax=Aliiglaciecola sp. LCG003 TaxID=3053655 RepID=UPI00257339FC|nr:Crp/Fnr family transcriptional regulator [Aliiglaciecola sp. LCG003]WJG08296.1 Crp/Fnr family transcriptional regulator [Aliiglaciecola sp. LCG003]
MDRQQLETLFKRNNWFSQLPETVINSLVGMSRLRMLPKGQQLHAKGDVADGLYCVLDGKIRVSNVNSHGKEMVLTWLDDGNWFGEISLFDGLPRTHDAHAEQATTLLMLPNQTFQKLLLSQPSLYPHFVRLLCQRIRATFSLLDETGGLSLQGQLAKRLLLLAGGLTNSEQAIQGATISISQESLAHMINSSRQTVNKILNQLKSQQVISSAYGKIKILDSAELIQLSEI